MTDVTFALAFFAGMLSFHSPCVLPMIPAYVSLITGLSLEDLQKRRHVFSGLGRMMSFVLGFSTIFMAMGASTSFVGSLFLEYQDYIRIAGGILAIFFGLFIAGFIQFNFLMREWRFNLSRSPAGYLGLFLLGMGFSAGWTPCTGPILGSILLYTGSSASASQGIALLAVYSAGFALPFILAPLAMNLFLRYIVRIRNLMRVIMIASGLVLIAFGIILLTDNFGWLSGLLPEWDIKL
jgi:cytochrome c-type biogenesis protein